MSKTKAPKIREALQRGTPVAQIAKRYKVSAAYVYSLRKTLAPVPVTQPVVLAAEATSELVERPPVGWWARVKQFFAGARA
jgi:hypothetical protein